MCDSGRPNAGDSLVHRLQQHLGKVQALDFSFDDRYACSLGGQDDNSLIVWDVASGRAVCGAPAASDSALTCKFLNRRNDRLVTTGNYHLRVWQVDVSIPKIHAMEANMGQLRRVIHSVAITDDDEFAYCGTKTGDLLRYVVTDMTR